MIELIAFSATCIVGFVFGAIVVITSLSWGIRNNRAYLCLDGQWIADKKPDGIDK